MTRCFGGIVVRFVVCSLSFFLLVDTAQAADYERARLEMVRSQIVFRGVRDEPTLAALSKVPRHKFVPEEMAPYAYQDRPLPIGYGQTISQPYIVALMTELLEVEPDFRVLEIGTGSGYQAAVLAEIVTRVYTLEIVKELAGVARKRLKADYPNVTVIHADGYFGWEDGAPYDGIIVTAAAEFIPPALIRQLKEGGKMVIPVGSPFGAQWLTLISKAEGVLTSQRLLPVRFVPFTRQ
ncbi:MAG: protein-L-isoaspartate(D-aspartate) O-methyltransferase [Desulfobulbaceae bacterium]|nr:protein-L-isoaspartate(D-aspartate) O-methyltransferase [Desulfobulbaceae bacterium]